MPGFFINHFQYESPRSSSDQESPTWIPKWFDKLVLNRIKRVSQSQSEVVYDGGIELPLRRRIQNGDENGSTGEYVLEEAKVEEPILELDCVARIWRSIENQDWNTVIGAIKKNRNLCGLIMTESGNRLIHVAVTHGDDSTLERMLDVVGVEGYSEVNYAGNSILHLAAMKNDLKMCFFIMSQNLGIFGMKNGKGETPLYLCPRFGCRESFDYLFQFMLCYENQLKHLVLDICVTNEHDNIMHVTIRKGWLDMACTIINELPGLVNLKNKSGETPLHCLGSYSRAFMSERVPGCYEFGTNVLCCLTKSEEINYSASNDFLTKALAFMKKIEVLSGWNPWDGQGPIVCAINSGITEMVQAILVAFGGVIGDQDKEGNNLLFVAAKGRKIDILKILLAKNNDLLRLWSYNKTGGTLLHEAAEFHEYKHWSDLGPTVHLVLEKSWYQCAQDSLPASMMHEKNDQFMTPDEVFISTHADLVKKSQEWIKNSTDALWALGSSFSFFAFGMYCTIPGGKQEDTSSYRSFNYSSWIAIVFGIVALFSVTGVRILSTSTKTISKWVLLGLFVAMTCSYLCCGSVIVAMVFGGGVAKNENMEVIRYVSVGGAILCEIYLIIWQWLPYTRIFKGIMWKF